MTRKIFLMSAVFSALFLISVPAYANKASAVIDAPDTAEKGSVITIKVTVSHKGNNFIHHVNWAYVKVNGKEVARSEFSAGNLPPDNEFVMEVKYTVDGPVDIVAEGNCNIHGTVGKVEKKIEVK